MAAKFHTKISETRETPVRSLAREMIIARVMGCHDGKAGKAMKWECDFIDHNSSQSVLLVDAWASNIPRAKSLLQEGNVYKITDYIISNPGKATTFGNNTIKLTIRSESMVEAAGDDYPATPNNIPTDIWVAPRVEGISR